MTGRCKDCRWFLKDSNRPVDEFGTCEIASSKDGIQTHKGTLAAAYDNEAYAAVFGVSPEFGCVQFERKGTE